MYAVSHIVTFVTENLDRAFNLGLQVREISLQSSVQGFFFCQALTKKTVDSESPYSIWGKGRG